MDDPAQIPIQSLAGFLLPGMTRKGQRSRTEWPAQAVLRPPVRRVSSQVNNTLACARPANGPAPLTLSTCDLLCCYQRG